jgi:hypothetical protein
MMTAVASSTLSLAFSPWSHEAKMTLETNCAELSAVSRAWLAKAANSQHGRVLVGRLACTAKAARS